MAKKVKDDKDPSTEEKIKAAARTVFTKKGYHATRTRDIAEEANINLALLNYYFRSKEKLYDLIMMEKMQEFLAALKPVFSNVESSLDKKIQVVAQNYINLLKTQPELPLFILNEIRSRPEKLAATMDVQRIVIESPFFRQLSDACAGRVHPVQILLNVLSLSVFPFAAAPLLKNVLKMREEQFDILMEERKKLIPLWVKTMINTKLRK